MDDAFYIELIGFIAAALTTAAFLPQVYRVWKTKDVKSLSLPMYVMIVIGIGLWFVYGILIGSPSMIAANGITVLSSIIILVYIIKHGNRKQ